MCTFACARACMQAHMHVGVPSYAYIHMLQRGQYHMTSERPAAVMKGSRTGAATGRRASAATTPLLQAALKVAAHGSMLRFVIDDPACLDHDHDHDGAERRHVEPQHMPWTATPKVARGGDAAAHRPIAASAALALQPPPALSSGPKKHRAHDRAPSFIYHVTVPLPCRTVRWAAPRPHAPPRRSFDPLNPPGPLSWPPPGAPRLAGQTHYQALQTHHPPPAPKAPP